MRVTVCFGTAAFNRQSTILPIWRASTLDVGAAESYRQDNLKQHRMGV